MKLVSKFSLIHLFCFTAFSAAADDYNNQLSQQTSTNTQNLVQYLKNLGGFLGYDISLSPDASHQTVSQELLQLSATQLAQNYVYNTFFGALPVNTLSEAFSYFVPPSLSGSHIINPLANTTFNYQEYSNVSSAKKENMTVSNLIDQKNYQRDPVSQALLNILGTPDFTYCMNSDQSAFKTDCKLLFQDKVIANILGPLPDTYQFFSFEYNQRLVGQLNSNALLGPLLYSAENNDQGTGSPTPKEENTGLTAQNQVQAAANFIRYASGAVTPASLPQLKTYDDIFALASTPVEDNVAQQRKQKQAQAALGTYLANLRVFAAQSSVGIGNLYYLLSKRLPQNQSPDKNPRLTSQAMSEFQMASWRLFNPDSSSNPQWINQLNKASAATVEKEIATLLAEINYQMYLDRQLFERILLTNSIMLIQNTKANQPKPNLELPEAAAANE